MAVFLLAGRAEELREGSMSITKVDLAHKVADDCGFLKGEAQEIVEKLL